jgi:hypothetical protein
MTFAALSGTTVGCASTPATGQGMVETPNPSARRTRDQISREELSEMSAMSLYEVVQRIHPEWLQSRNQVGGGRNTSTASVVQVYMDTQRLGTVDMLRQISVNAAASLRYYSAADAQARFGTGNNGGAIQIISTTGKP